MIELVKQLSVPQLLVLSTAAKRPSRMIMPLPEGLRVRGASQRVLLSSLLSLLLIEELHTDELVYSWRRDEHGQNFALVPTLAGMAAVGIFPVVDAGVPGSGVICLDAAKTTFERERRNAHICLRYPPDE